MNHLCRFETGDIRTRAEEEVIPPDSIRKSNERIWKHLKQGCAELMEQHPAQKRLFLDCAKKQEEENDVLENRVVCSVMVLKRK